MSDMLSRSNLQPRLVELIAGLRRHQVEEAVALLLNYVDARKVTEPPPAGWFASYRGQWDTSKWPADYRRLMQGQDGSTEEGARTLAMLLHLACFLALDLGDLQP